MNITLYKSRKVKIISPLSLLVIAITGLLNFNVSAQTFDVVKEVEKTQLKTDDIPNIAPVPSVFEVKPLYDNTIVSINSFSQKDFEILKITFDKDLIKLPENFSILSPSRVILDFPGIIHSLKSNLIESNLVNLKSIMIAQQKMLTRLVLNLKLNSTYELSIEGKVLVIKLQEKVLALNKSTKTNFTENQEISILPSNQDNSLRNALTLTDFEFKRGDSDSAKIIFNLPDSKMGVDVTQQGQSLNVEFSNAIIPQGMNRKFDVTDFGTPVQLIKTIQDGNKVKMVIEANGQWTHSAYQNESLFVIEIRKNDVDKNKPSSGQGYTGKKMSLNFQNIDVRSLLQVIADFTNFNIISSDSVKGTLTLRLQDVPWDQALDIILQSKNLGMRKTGNVMMIAPSDEISAREKKIDTDLEDREKMGALVTRVFPLKYTRATSMASRLNGVAPTAAAGDKTNQESSSTSASGALPKFLSLRGSAIAESRSNRIFVTDVETRMERISQLISDFDVPTKTNQVLIEARIVEASDTFGRSLGVKLGGVDLRAQQGGDGGYALGAGNRVTFGSSYSNAAASSGQGGNVDLSSNTINLPAIGFGGYNPSTFALSIFSAAANRFLNLELSALESDGKGRVISSPRIVTADQVPALIEQGTELPYQVASSSGATSIAFRKANLKLEVTPYITPEGLVSLELDINKDTVGQQTTAGFAINTKHIKTSVMMDNGGTVVIGGIFELIENTDETKVPVLGDIPTVGNIFKNKTKTSTKQEMLVFITPRIIDNRTEKL